MVGYSDSSTLRPPMMYSAGEASRWPGADSRRLLSSGPACCRRPQGSRYLCYTRVLCRNFRRQESTPSCRALLCCRWRMLLRRCFRGRGGTSRSGPGVVDEYVDNRSEPRCRVAMYAVINSPMATTRYLLREFIVKKLFRTWCILCTMSGRLTNLIFLQIIEDVGGEPFNVFLIRVRAGVLAPFIGGEAVGHAAAV